MANYREEHIRNNRRLARQVVGAAALLLALIGLFTVLGWIVGLVRAALDDTDLRNEYRDRLYGMVMLDPVAFDDVNSVDEGIFKQAAIWGTVYQVQNSGGSLDQYERDPDTGSALIPALEIDTYISNLLGPDYQVTEGTFSTAEFVYQYDEEKQAYLVPVTSSVALYTPTVEKITKKDGQRIVTVGYVPTSSNNATGELSLTAPTEPTKYMDYVFTRGENRQWYLTALRDSDMQVEVTPIPAPTDAVVDNMQNEEMGTSDAASTEPAPVPEEGAEVASGMMASATPNSSKSCAVIRIISQASCSREASFQRIEAAPRGEMTEYRAFSSMARSSHTPSARAPPLPPSPSTTETTGVFRDINSAKFFAMASPCPRSSASTPQNAPGVSMKQMIGRWNFSACFASRNAFR